MPKNSEKPIKKPAVKSVVLKGNKQSSLPHKTFQFIKENSLISSGDCVLVGISGGADSCALLHILNTLRHNLGLRLHAAHFNHNVRRGADSDQKFVEHFCAQLNIPCTTQKREGSLKDKLSEDQMRTMRYAFFKSVVKSVKANVLALGHTQNDVAETVLMRIIRGSGLYGLKAIVSKRNIDGMTVVRPLLPSSRTEIEGYLKQHKITFCTDETNATSIYLRNQLRGNVFPLLKTFNPQIVSALSTLANVVSDDYDFLKAHADESFKKKVVRRSGRLTINLRDLKEEHAAIRRLILRLMVESASAHPNLVSFFHIDQIERLSEKPMGTILHLPSGLRAWRTKTSIGITSA